jgi:uncharacterized protein (TIGR02246 family)
MTDLVSADCGIRQLHGRFMDAVWRQDAESFGDCFARDGEWKIAGMHLKSRATIAETCPKLLGRCEKIQLVTLPAMIELTEGGASGRVHMIEFAKMLDGSSAMTIGVYHDRYVEEGGRWRYAWRHWSFKYRGPADLSAAFVDTPDYGAFPNMPEQDEPTYVRPA